MRELLSAISEVYQSGGAGSHVRADRDSAAGRDLAADRKAAPSLRQAAEEFGITMMKARKLLITADVYHTEISDTVNALKAEGMSVPEIMANTGLKRSSVHSYLPYTKGIYNLKELSLYAERCRLYRARKRAVAALAACWERDGEEGEWEEKLWEAIQAFAGYRFSTVTGLRFSYWVSGNEMVVDRKKKAIVRSSVVMALRRVREAGGNIKGPKSLGIYGASYLYPVFVRLGLIHRKDPQPAEAQ